jgi:hypothetical protein
MRDEHETFRAWRPGDGIRCTYTHRAADGIPCGPPVVVVTADLERVGRVVTRRTTLLCSNHLVSRFAPGGQAMGQLTARRDREAREAVLAAHWEEYQVERDKRTAVILEQLAAAVPDEYRQMVADGLQAHADERPPGTG